MGKQPTYTVNTEHAVSKILTGIWKLKNFPPRHHLDAMVLDGRLSYSKIMHKVEEKESSHRQIVSASLASSSWTVHSGVSGRYDPGSSKHAIFCVFSRPKRLQCRFSGTIICSKAAAREIVWMSHQDIAVGRLRNNWVWIVQLRSLLCRTSFRKAGCQKYHRVLHCGTRKVGNATLITDYAQLKSAAAGFAEKISGNYAGVSINRIFSGIRSMKPSGFNKERIPNFKSFSASIFEDYQYQTMVSIISKW